MKKILFVMMAGFLMGCASGADTVKSLIEDPPALLRDPQFSSYQEQVENLERSYLHKEISYADYLERRRRLDDDYNQVIQERQRTIENNPER